MMQIWQQIRLGKHVGFEEGEWCATRCDVGRRDAVLVPLSVSVRCEHGQHLWSAVVVNSEPGPGGLGLGCLWGFGIGSGDLERVFPSFSAGECVSGSTAQLSLLSSTRAEWTRLWNHSGGACRCEGSS